MKGRLSAGVLGLSLVVPSCALVAGYTGEGIAGASTPPGFYIVVDGFNALGGVPFSYPVGFELNSAGGPESLPVTVTVGPGALAPEETLLSVPTPADPHWDCSGSDIAAQTIICVYTPTSPIPPGTRVTFDINAVMSYSSSFYQDIAYAVPSSPDANPTQAGGDIINLNVSPDGVALGLALSDSLAAPSAAIPGVNFNYLANVSVGEAAVGAPSEGQPISITDTLPAGTVLTAEPFGTGWDCSASVLGTSTVSCAYSPPAGGIPQGTVLPTVVEPARLTDSTVGDALTNTAAASSSDTAGATASDVVSVASADTTPPTVTNVAATPIVTTLGNGTTLSATVADTESGGTNVIAAQYNINGGSWTPMTGSFGSPTASVSATIPAPTSPVAETLCVRGEDGAGNWSDGTACTSFVVYSPTGGFVTGGGWITSPSGACLNTAICGPDASGKATFGFVSKYQKGANEPSGNTEYDFHAGGLNFTSSTYQWLVVNQNGTNAQFKGSGTVNGAGNYMFMIWANASSPETFRVQITNSANNSTVYDSGSQPLGGGSIIVHA